MKLKEYIAKRRFAATPEPKAGDHPAGDRLIFVVQKHAARAMHYDLRLEMDGVLKSWAIPKGPSLNPSQKHLAVMVEDHPFDYKDFEGVIPKGNYGAGSVIIWDRGFYHHPEDPDGTRSVKLLREGLQKGHLTFILHGEKLRGEFALVKTRLDDKSWLLVKKKDRFATARDILQENRSVVSHKNLEELSGKGDPPLPADRDLQGAPAKPMPRKIRPMLATLAQKPFDHQDWLFEMKWDGYRAIAEIRNGDVALYSRNEISFAKKFSPVLEALAGFRFAAILDGEIVVVDREGRPDFQRLQDYPKSKKGHLVYYVFDLLYFQGRDLTGLPLTARKALLKKILPSSAIIKFSDHIVRDGIAFFQAVQDKGLEGIMAKQAASTYHAGKRSSQWLKIKTHLTQEGVIAGFTAPRGGRNDFGALVLGVYEKEKLVFIGHTGGGFSRGLLEEIRARLNPLIRKTCPFKMAPETNTSVTWVRPKLVCEVVFHGWTSEGLMRQPVFLRMREDRDPRDVVRETGLQADLRKTAGQDSP